MKENNEAKNVKEFMQEYAADKALREQLKDKNADEVVAFAGSLGYTFTKEDLEAFGRSILELTPEQMEQAAGGSDSELQDWIEDAREEARKAYEKTVDNIGDAYDKTVNGFVYVVDEVAVFFKKLFS